MIFNLEFFRLSSEMGEMEAIFSHQHVTSITDVKEAISANLEAELVNFQQKRITLLESEFINSVSRPENLGHVHSSSRYFCDVDFLLLFFLWECYFFLYGGDNGFWMSVAEIESATIWKRPAFFRLQSFQAWGCAVWNTVANSASVIPRSSTVPA